MPKQEKLRVGVIGTGIGRTHLAGYQKSPLAEIHAVCDIDEPRGKKAAEEFGAKRFYNHYEKLMADGDVDVVSVCVPNDLHAEMAVAGLEAGKHVLCEKPMANTLANAQKIEAAADQATAKGQKFMLGMNNRFSANSQVLKRFIDQGELGEIYYARCGWIRRNGIPGFGGWFTTKARSGGGPLIDIGVHALDVTLYFMGSPAPVSVVGSAYAKFGPRGQGKSNWGVQTPGATSFDVEDMAAGLVKLENGATLVLEVSWASHVKAEGVFSHLFGTEGGADWNPLTVYKNVAGAPADITPAVPKGPGGHEAEILHFCQCVVEDKPPISTARQGLHVLQILDALYRSAESGREVVIGE